MSFDKCKHKANLNGFPACKKSSFESPSRSEVLSTSSSPILVKKKWKKASKEESLSLYNSLDIFDEEDEKSRALAINEPDFSTRNYLNNLSNSTCSSDAMSSPQGTAVIPRSLTSDFTSDFSDLSAEDTKEKPQSKNSREVYENCSEKGYTSKYTNSLEDSLFSASSSSFTSQSPASSRQNSVQYPTSGLPISSPSSFNFSGIKTPGHRRRLNIFNKTSNYSLSSSSMSSLHSAHTVANDIKIPSPARFAVMYNAVRKGVSEHLSVNTAELNVLQVRKNEAGLLNAAQSYESEKLVKHLERVTKKLQFLQIQLDEAREAYVLQQRYREGANKLKSALNSSPVNSRSSLLEIKSDICRCTETLCALEQELSGLLGKFHIEMNGLLGFARLRAGDHYDVVIRYGPQKWRMKGSVTSSVNQTWDNTQKTLQPLLTDLIHIKDLSSVGNLRPNTFKCTRLEGDLYKILIAVKRVMEGRMLGTRSTVGNIFCETKDLFKVEPQDVLVDLNDTATLKLSLKITWIPYEGYESPPNMNSGKTSFLAPTARARTKSVTERPVSTLITPRSRLSTAYSRPLSVAYSSTNANNHNSNGLRGMSTSISNQIYLKGRNSTGSSEENSNEDVTIGAQVKTE